MLQLRGVIRRCCRVLPQAQVINSKHGPLKWAFLREFEVWALFLSWYMTATQGFQIRRPYEEPAVWILGQGNSQKTPGCAFEPLALQLLS